MGYSAQTWVLLGIATLSVLFLLVPASEGLVHPRGNPQKAADPIVRRGSRHRSNFKRAGAGAHQNGTLIQ